MSIPGSINFGPDFCASAETDVLLGAAQAALKEIACADYDDCDVEIASICGHNSRRSLSSRNLQTTDESDVVYEINVSFSCSIASCSSHEDIATFDAISAAIDVAVADSLTYGDFLNSLVNVPGLLISDSTTSVACMAVYGQTHEPVASVVSDGSAIGPALAFYPDWGTDSGTCLSDGNAPPYMKKDEGWLFSSLEQCCAQHFSGWRNNNCMHKKGSGLWYVSDEDDKCVRDCTEGQGATCGGLVHLGSNDLFTKPRNCCETKLPWVFSDFCEADSLLSSCYGGTGRWYRGDIAGSEVCIEDCRVVDGGNTACGGLVQDSFVTIHDSVEDCCSSEYGWMQNELCATRSNKTTTDKYWPDEIKGRCFSDSDTPATDMGISLFDSAGECCLTSLWWLSEAVCLAASGAASTASGTGKYYILWDKEKCAIDENDNLAEAWDELFDGENECCDKLSWIDREHCVYAGVPV